MSKIIASQGGRESILIVSRESKSLCNFIQGVFSTSLLFP